MNTPLKTTDQLISFMLALALGLARGAAPVHADEPIRAEEIELAAPSADVPSTPLVVETPLAHSLQLNDKHRYVGTASCSATNCHGNRDERGATLRREYAIWATLDPHSNAYATLFSERSKRIVARLNDGELRSGDKAAALPQAHQRADCVACHTTHVNRAQLVDNHRYTIHDGVGCESCHGSAEKWLKPHTTAAWRDETNGWTNDKKREAGFYDTDDLVIRAQTCVRCHVGSRGRDVNHDLIAAGHPRLYFELSAYHANMPRHWSRAKDLDNDHHGPTLEARLWAVGQIVSLAAASDMLALRAADDNKPWPEFAEYGCFACHQDLGIDTQRRQPIDPDLPPGSLPWATWHTGMLKVLQSEDDGMQTTSELLAKLRLEASQPFSKANRASTQSLALQLRDQLNDHVTASRDKQLAEADLVRYLAGVTDVESQPSRQDWDEMTQRYLAAVALRQALVDTRREQQQAMPGWIEDVDADLKNIRGQLEFPSDGRKQHSSPFGFRSSVGEIRRLFGEIHGRVANE